MHHINEIGQFSEISDWNYIPSEQNPSDLCTRTHAAFKLIPSKWFYGPETTHQKTLDLKEINIRNQFEESFEINISLITHSSKKENCNNYQIIKWDRLVRHVALLVKIKQNWVNSKFCRIAQLESYPEQYNQLNYNKAIPKNSSLICCSRKFETINEDYIDIKISQIPHFIHDSKGNNMIFQKHMLQNSIHKFI